MWRYLFLIPILIFTNATEGFSRECLPIPTNVTQDQQSELKKSVWDYNGKDVSVIIKIGHFKSSDGLGHAVEEYQVFLPEKLTIVRYYKYDSPVVLEVNGELRIGHFAFYSSVFERKNDTLECISVPVADTDFLRILQKHYGLMYK